MCLKRKPITKTVKCNQRKEKEEGEQKILPKECADVIRETRSYRHYYARFDNFSSELLAGSISVCQPFITHYSCNRHCRSVLLMQPKNVLLFTGSFVRLQLLTASSIGSSARMTLSEKIFKTPLENVCVITVISVICSNADKRHEINHPCKP